MSIDKAHFDKGCLAIQYHCHRLDGPTQWQEVKVLQAHEEEFLRIVKHTNQPDSIDCKADGEVDEVIEDDDEILTRQPKGSSELLIVYDIVHSPSYQVPVVYVTFKSTEPDGSYSRAPSSLEKVCELLSPTSLRPQLEAVGVMGALSMTDHPITDLPAYFVHPCRTAKAMESVIGNRDVGPEKYILKWMGLIGQSVGLDVPVELAQAMEKA